MMDSRKQNSPERMNGLEKNIMTGEQDTIKGIWFSLPASRFRVAHRLIQ